MLDKSKDSWNTLHDLCLVYFAVAYGADHELADDELTMIGETVQRWNPEASREEVHETVMEAMAILLDETSRSEVIQAIERLRNSLSDEEKTRALEEIVEIASADGILLRSEHSLISVLAELWDLKHTGRKLLENASVPTQEAQRWSLLHDFALLCVVVAHSPDNELSRAEISAIMDRLHEWQPDLEQPHLEDVLRDALQVYAAGPEQQAIQKSVGSIRESMPAMQRLILLDDLVALSRIEGEMDSAKESMINALSKAWNVNVRLDGFAEA